LEPEVPMKGKIPKYKLQSNIVVATELKKVLEESNLNTRVESTLGEVLGIAQCEFDEVIANIIEHKKQTMTDTMTSNMQGKKGVEDDKLKDDKLDVDKLDDNELEDDELEGDESNDVDDKNGKHGNVDESNKQKVEDKDCEDFQVNKDLDEG